MSSLSGAGDVPSVQKDAGQSSGHASSCRTAHGSLVQELCFCK